MSRRILQLSALIANQIAAGEVIERPASVVKELLENALDAKASQITIDIGYGGLNQIRISDNGLGIVAEDLPLAMAAHATSKITHLNDLYAVTSMGFRGEALASIASIARVTISSRPASQQHGMQLDNRDQFTHLTPCARSQGTTVDVRDIFYNAPVRKKFLKTEKGEYQLIDSLVRRFALSAPHIAINLQHNGKSQLQLPAAINEQSRLQRINRIMGKQFLEHALELDAEQAGYRLQGWICGADYQRSQSDKLLMYINGRMVKDKLLQHAVRQAYEDLLPPGRYPVGLLYLTVNPEEVDVNVHPTKHEVRFQQARLVHDFISSQLRKLLTTGKSPDHYIPQQRDIPLMLCENYLSPKSKEAVEKPQHIHFNAHNWYRVSDRFVLIKMAATSYLVDIKGLQQASLLDKLQLTDLPLASRPLLVPIFIQPPSLTTLALQQLRHLGITLDFMADKCLIRTLPILVANLDITGFLQTFAEGGDLSIEAAFELLASHQRADGENLDEEQQLDLYQYFKQNRLHLSGLSKELNEATWVDLLNAK